MLHLVRERGRAGNCPLEAAIDPDDRCSRPSQKAWQKNPYAPSSLAFAAWVLARLGGWIGYYGKPGPVVMLRGLVQFHAIKHGRALRNV